MEFKFKISLVIFITIASGCLQAQEKQIQPTAARIQDSSQDSIPADSLVMQKQPDLLIKVSDEKSQPDSAIIARADSTAPVKIDTIRYFSKEIIRPLIRSSYFDSTIIRGSAYGSFGDVFDRLPGTFYFDYGSVGQPAIGSLFAGFAEKFVLNYDGLVLNDLLNGYADLNLIPTESVRHIDVPLTGHRQTDVFSPLGQTLQLTSYQMAHLPIRSRVAYRTGKNGYDDIDVRLGIQASPKLAVNIGGILKNYAGTTLYSKYRAQKINVKLQRFLTRTWSVQYLLLYNIYDLDSPVFSVSDFRYVHHKDARFDHGFVIKNSQSFSTIVQFTRLHREMYSPARSLFDELHEADQIRIVPQWHHSIGSFKIAAGALYQSLRLKNSDWGSHGQDQAALHLDLSRQAGKLTWLAGMQVNEKTRVQPQLSLNYALTDCVNVFFWTQQRDAVPSLQALYANNKMEQGVKDLKRERYSDITIGFEKISRWSSLFGSLSYSSPRDFIFPSYQSQEPGFVYQNFSEHYFISADMATSWQLFDWLVLFAKAKYIKQQHNFTWPNLPAVFGCGYVQIHRIFFKNDLNMYLRLGFSAMDSRKQSWSVSAQGSQSLDPFFAPYIHGIFHIKDVTLFAAFQNILMVDYRRMTDYPMPSAQFRWGLVWNFWD